MVAVAKRPRRRPQYRTKPFHPAVKCRCVLLQWRSRPRHRNAGIVPASHTRLKYVRHAAPPRLRAPLHFAVCEGGVDMISLLLSAHADVNARDAEYRPYPCMCICDMQLILCSASLRTALHYSVVNRRFEVLALLLTAKADVDAKDSEYRGCLCKRFCNAALTAASGSGRPCTTRRLKATLTRAGRWFQRKPTRLRETGATQYNIIYNNNNIPRAARAHDAVCHSRATLQRRRHTAPKRHRTFLRSVGVSF